MRLGGLQKVSLIDYPGKISAIVFTYGCNFRCPYCHNPELVEETGDEIDEDSVLSFLATRVGKLDAVTITGGEPTMHVDLPDFISKIKNLGFLVKLDTNGTNPNMVKEILDKGIVDYIAMDMKSPLQKYATVVNRPVNIENIRESIEILKQSRTAYEFRTTLVKGLVTPEDIAQIGAEIHGAKRYYLQKFVSTKILNPSFIRKTTYTDDELEEFRTLLLEHVDECEIR